MSPPLHSREDPSVVEEAVLITRIGVGDREAFRELYRRYSTPLFSLAIRVTSDRGAAEEALQDTFLKIWRSAASFNSCKSRPLTWAMTIARRTCIDRLRRMDHQPASAEWADVATLADLQTPDVVRSSAERHEDDQRLRHALNAVPATQRRALELALFSGLSYPQIAARIKQPVGTVKTWIRRGLLDLRSLLNITAP